MIRLQARRSPCEPAEAERAIAALESHEGLYFGVDAGIPGLHPLQATVAVRPAVRLAVYADGVQATALTPFGAALLAQPGLHPWRAASGRGAGTPALQQLRAFLRCFAPSPDTLLLGALRFEAWKLGPQGAAAPKPVIPAQAGSQHALQEPGALDSRLRGHDQSELGVFYLPERVLRRDADGRWASVALEWPGVVAGTDPVPIHAQAAPPSAEPQDDLAPGGYARMVERAVAVLRERPLVSLTLSQSYRRRVAIAASEAFARLRAANPAPATFFLNDGSGLRLFGASPDLQLVIRGGVVETLPVCGTVARRPGAQGEAESLRELFNEDVDAAALAICSDALRNDLAPLCEPGSLHLADRRRPMSLATVVHAVDRVVGRLRRDADAWDAVAATAAPVMLTGTPRAEALRAIGELEASPRGWYGGMAVQVASNGDALVGTLLRAAAVRDGIAEVRTGGDLLADSDPQREEAESRLKTRSLWRAFGLEQAPAAAAAATQPAADADAGSVNLQADGDAFAAALADCLRSLELRHEPAAPVAVWAGDGPRPPGPVVAIGDAAYRLLQAAGASVERCGAEHGRAVHGTTAAGQAFIAGRYASWRLLAPPPGWQVLASDDTGLPLALARDTAHCLLFRPDSLLADDVARQLLRQAVAAAERAA